MRTSKLRTSEGKPVFKGLAKDFLALYRAFMHATMQKYPAMHDPPEPAKEEAWPA
jgi:hypothetical protein